MKSDLISQLNEKKYNMPLSEHVNNIYNIYLSTLNNEDETILNDSDNRYIFENQYIYPYEVGVNVNGVRYGSCKRKIYFKTKGVAVTSEDDGTLDNMYLNIKIRNLVTEHWLEKFRKLNLLEKIEEEYVELFGIKIRLLNNLYYVKDETIDKKYILLIKVVNDSAANIRNKIFSNNPNVLNEHAPELAILMLALKKPVKLLYVGKNNGLFKEFNIGIKNNFVTINNKETIFNVKDIYNDLYMLNQQIVNDELPDMDFIINKFLNMDEAKNLIAGGIVDNRFFDINKPYTSFQCNGCQYKIICERGGKL